MSAHLNRENTWNREGSAITDNFAFHQGKNWILFPVCHLMLCFDVEFFDSEVLTWFYANANLIVRVLGENQ